MLDGDHLNSLQPLCIVFQITIMLLPMDNNRHTCFEATRCTAGEEEREAVEGLKAAGTGKKKQGDTGAVPKDKHTQGRGKAAPDKAVKEGTGE